MTARLRLASHGYATFHDRETVKRVPIVLALTAMLNLQDVADENLARHRSDDSTREQF
jgi:hypothetical protein